MIFEKKVTKLAGFKPFINTDLILLFYALKQNKSAGRSSSCWPLIGSDEKEELGKINYENKRKKIYKFNINSNVLNWICFTVDWIGTY